MNQSHLSPDDPKLTAYALGELDDPERQAVELALLANPALRAQVDEIRNFATQLSSSLDAEAVPEIAPRSARPLERAAIIRGNDPGMLDGGPLTRGTDWPFPFRTLIKFPQFYYVVGALAAAAVAILLAWSEPTPHRPTPQKSYAQIVLTEHRDEPTARENGDTSKASAADPNAAQDPAAAAVGSSDRVTLPEFRISSAPPPVSGGKERPAWRIEESGLHHDSEFVAVANEPLSTIPPALGSTSYTELKQALRTGQLPSRNSVRIEELINYFPYHDLPPTDRAPIAATVEVASAPWETNHRLVRVGLKGRAADPTARAPANLVFLFERSSSMNQTGRLGVVQEALRRAVARLHPDDRVAIVTYGDSSALALPSTPVARANEVLAALEGRPSEGPPGEASALALAYEVAKANFVPAGQNRVILCTDGDFNVGATSRDEFLRIIEEQAKANVFFSVLGVGPMNPNDQTRELLADRGHGKYGSIQSRQEGERFLVEQAGDTLPVIARDVSIQVEFNPELAKAYRLIGYENPSLKKEVFGASTVQVGEVPAGYAITALYEVIPASSDEVLPGPAVKDELKYRRPASVAARDSNPKASMSEASRELLTVKIRYKEPADDTGKKLEFPLVDGGREFAAASSDFKFAAGVAGFGLALRAEPVKATLLADAASWAEGAVGDDPGGYRADFNRLVRQTRALVR